MGRAGITAQSKTLTREAAKAHKADPKSVKGIVQKLESEVLADNTSIMNRARSFLDERSLPWLKGLRLVPLTNYNEVRKGLDKFSDEWNDSVAALLSQYDELRRDYLRRVNDLADEVEFPSRQKLEMGFRFGWTEMPLANPDDIRLKHISAKAVAEIKANISEQMETKLRSAQVEIVDRLKELILNLKEKTEDTDRRMFQSLIKNIEDAVDVLPSLNITNDPEINRLINDVKSKFTGIDVDDLKKDEKARAVVAKQASTVLDDIKKSFGR